MVLLFRPRLRPLMTNGPVNWEYEKEQIVQKNNVCKKVKGNDATTSPEMIDCIQLNRQIDIWKALSEKYNNLVVKPSTSSRDAIDDDDMFYTSPNVINTELKLLVTVIYNIYDPLIDNVVAAYLQRVIEKNPSYMNIIKSNTPSSIMQNHNVFVRELLQHVPKYDDEKEQYSHLDIRELGTIEMPKNKISTNYTRACNDHVSVFCSSNNNIDSEYHDSREYGCGSSNTCITKCLYGISMDQLKYENVSEFEMKYFQRSPLKYAYTHDYTFTLYLYKNIKHELGMDHVPKSTRIVTHCPTDKPFQGTPHKVLLYHIAAYIDDVNDDDTLVMDLFENCISMTPELVADYKYFAELADLIDEKAAREKRAKYIRELKKKHKLTNMPCYNVREMARIDVPKSMFMVDKQKYVCAWQNLVMADIQDKVDENMLPFFRVFPIKDSHLVLDDGRVVFLNVDLPRNHDAIHKFITSLCSFNDIELFLGDFVQTFDIRDLFSYCVTSAKTLKVLGICLTALRLFYGPQYMYISDMVHYVIYLPTLNDVMMWLEEPHCINKELHKHLPNIAIPNVTAHHKAQVVALPQFMECEKLINLIVHLSKSDIDACILCSSFLIPEIFYYHLMEIFITMGNNNKKYNYMYVLLTLIIQQYPLALYKKKRDMLPVSFHKNMERIIWPNYTKELDYFRNTYRAFPQINTDPYKDVHHFSLIHVNRRRLCATDTNDDVRNNFQQYEFVSERLRKLVELGTDICLTPAEFSRYLLYVINAEHHNVRNKLQKKKNK